MPAGRSPVHANEILFFANSVTARQAVTPISELNLKTSPCQLNAPPLICFWVHISSIANAKRVDRSSV